MRIPRARTDIRRAVLPFDDGIDLVAPVLAMNDKRVRFEVKLPYERFLVQIARPLKHFALEVRLPRHAQALEPTFDCQG
jgi:hypothetical protein